MIACVQLKINLIRQLIPLYVCTAVGMFGALYYMTRLATRNPDVTWNRQTNPEPWQEYRTKQYKVTVYSKCVLSGNLSEQLL